LTVVIDSSVVVAALIDTGSDGAWAEKILGSGELSAPAMLLAEVTNVLRRLVGNERITEPEANAAFEDLMQLTVDLHTFEPFAERVWELRHNVTSYDGWYVAIAEALDSPLATLDGRLVRAQGPECRFLTRGSG
jgi:predicted nucleic acid-binding protein